jgi:signal transduction histidine kinase/ActR/RegA family two-component response regulator
VATFGLGRSQTCKIVAPCPAEEGDDEMPVNAMELHWLASAAPDHIINLAEGEQYERYRQLEGLAPDRQTRILIAPLAGRDRRNIGLMVLVTGDDSHDIDGNEALFSQFAQTTSIAIENTLFANAREANRLKDEFLATLSHELRTPLTAIVGWVQLLRMGTLDAEESAHGLEIIDRSVAMQTRLIEDLLDISRIVAGKFQVQMRLMDFRTAVQAAVEIVRPQADAKHLQLELQLGAGPAWVQGDPGRLQQVVWNLLSNSVKFTPDRGRISVELAACDQSLELSVSDSGQGISPGFLPHVFDRFWQADSTTTRSYGGLGIGLALVRSVVESHGGDVAAQSDGEGRGSRFTVRLPQAAPASAANGNPVDLPSLGSGDDHAASLKGFRILVVEDHAEARDVLVRTLKGRGAETLAASSATEAIKLLDRFPLDLLISDIGLPQMDGYALMRHLRRSTGCQNARIPAIALTALARDHDKQLAIRAGYDFHLSKPVDMAELVRVAANLVRACKPAAPAQPVTVNKEPIASAAVPIR